MANVIILIYGEGRHLVPKPADYESLLDIARVKFPELHNLDNHNIAFHVTPEWFNGDVELDRNAFAEVQDREILRISTTASGTAQQPCNYFKIRGDSVLTVRPDEMKVLPPGWLKLWFIHGKCMTNRASALHQTLAYLHLALGVETYTNVSSSY